MTQQEPKFGMRKIYRKSWPYDNLFGSLRFETSSGQRGIWNDLLDLAKLSRVAPGLVSPAPGQAYPHAWLAEFLNVPLDLLEETLAILIKTDRIVENHTGIRIVNWYRYQTEADRQRPYKDRKRAEEMLLPPNLPQEGTEESEEVDISSLLRREEALETWKVVLEKLQLQVSKSNFRTWLKETEGLGYKGDCFVVGVPSTFVAEYLDKNQRSLIEKTLIGIIKRKVVMLPVPYKPKRRRRK